MKFVRFAQHSAILVRRTEFEIRTRNSVDFCPDILEGADGEMYYCDSDKDNYYCTPLNLAHPINKM